MATHEVDTDDTETTEGTKNTHKEPVVEGMPGPAVVRYVQEIKDERRTAQLDQLIADLVNNRRATH